MPLAARPSQLRRLSPASRATAVRDLQARIGNQAVARLLGEGSPLPVAMHPDRGGQLVHAQPLPGAVRVRMETAFGADFSSVRVRSDDGAHDAARALGARAFSDGESLTFAAGWYAPGRPDGVRLLAHELAHVVQARAAEAGLKSRAATDAAEGQADRMASDAVAGVRIKESPLPVAGVRLDRARPGELELDDEILAVLEASVEAEDRAAQRQRIDRLAEIFTKLMFWDAAKLAARLEKPAPRDKLAQAFHYRLSSETRDMLIGRLRAQAASIAGLYSKYNDPRQDPDYIENVVDRVECMLIVADRYTLVWEDGRKTVFNADIDWTKTTKALPVLDIKRDEATAKAAAQEWSDVAVATKYDRAVAFYRGPGGAILPTWFSPETTPKTYDLIIGVNAQVRETAAAAEHMFRGLRNGLVMGMILGGVLRFVIRWPGGGGGVPKPGGGDVDVPGGRGTTTTKPPIQEPPVTGRDIPTGAAKEPAVVESGGVKEAGTGPPTRIPPERPLEPDRPLTPADRSAITPKAPAPPPRALVHATTTDIAKLKNEDFVFERTSADGRTAVYRNPTTGQRANVTLRQGGPRWVNPAWGRNRLEAELRNRGFTLGRPTRGEGGFLYRNASTGEEIRIMPRPTEEFRGEPIEKHLNNSYYRYRPRNDVEWGEHTTIPDKE